MTQPLVEQKAEVLSRYDKLTVAARYYLLGRGFTQALNALEFGRELHDGTRKDGFTPEFMHQIQIFHWLRTLESSLIYPQDTFVAAFMHDAPEDKSEVTHKMMREQYTPLSAEAIFNLDKNGKSEAEYFFALSKDPVGSVVKLADRIHNMSTMVGVFTREKQLKYMSEVEYNFMPMLKRARRTFPQQEPIYENAKHVLNIQLDLLEVINREKQ